MNYLLWLTFLTIYFVYNQIHSCLLLIFYNKKTPRDFFSKAFVFELIKIFHNTIITQVILSLQYHFTFIFFPIYSQFTFNLLSQYSHTQIPSIYQAFFYLKNIKNFINFHKTKIKLRKSRRNYKFIQKNNGQMSTFRCI